MRQVAAVVIFAGLGISGCGDVPMKFGSNDCDGHGACTVEVSVDNCVATATPDQLPVTAKNQVITWKIDKLSDRYVFRPNDGVALKDPGDDQFEPREAGQSNMFKLHDKNNMGPPPRTYRYKLNVQKIVSGGPRDCPATDPTIVNQG